MISRISGKLSANSRSQRTSPVQTPLSDTEDGSAPRLPAIARLASPPTGGQLASMSSDSILSPHERKPRMPGKHGSGATERCDDAEAGRRA